MTSAAESSVRRRRRCRRRASSISGDMVLMLVAPMLTVKLDPEDPENLHEQVAGAVRRAIADGEIRPGERLPPARDLAAVLQVNSNTVLRALRMLRAEGLLEFRRGRGITVVGTPQQGILVTRTRELLQLARDHGYRRSELIELLESLT
jgi:GntR family transcriptional regulator